MRRANSSVPVLAAAALLVGAALAAWWWAAEPGTASEAARGAAPVRRAEDAPREAEPAPPTPAEVVERVERSAQAERVLEVFLHGTVRTRDGAAARVELIVAAASGAAASGAAGALQGPLAVREITRERSAARSYAHGSVTRSGADGAYRIEISKLVRSRLGEAQRGGGRLDLWVKALRTGESPREFAIAIALEPRWLAAPGPVELRADLELSGVGRVYGRVSSSEPLESGAWAALFQLEGETPRPQPIVHTLCDETTGAFEFTAEADLEVLLVACSERRRPRTERVRVSDRSRPLELELEPGARIDGVLRLGPDPVQASLQLELAADNFTLCRLAEHALTWDGVGFEWSRPQAMSDPHGRFEFIGLAPARYRVTIATLRRGVYASSFEGFELRAPAANVTLELPLARVELALVRNGAPAAGAALSLCEQRGPSVRIDTLHADALGVAVLWLAEDSLVWVNEPSKGVASAHNGVRVSNPGPGASTRVRIDL